MLTLDQVIEIKFTAGEVQSVLAGLAELPFKISAPIIDKVRAAVLDVDPEAFNPGTTRSAVGNGRIEAQ